MPLAPNPPQGSPSDETGGVIRNLSPSQRLIGYVVDVGHPDGRARAFLDVAADHANRVGILHGGFMAMLLDAAMGYAASLEFGDGDANQKVVTVSMTTNFVAPAKIGTRITAIGQMSGGGRKLAQVSGEVVDEHGQLLATATGVFRKVSA